MLFCQCHFDSFPFDMSTNSDSITYWFMIIFFSLPYHLQHIFNGVFICWIYHALKESDFQVWSWFLYQFLYNLKLNYVYFCSNFLIISTTSHLKRRIARILTTDTKLPSHAQVKCSRNCSKLLMKRYLNFSFM